MAENVKAFICHSSLDKEFAARLSEDLRSRGVSVWLDKSVLRVGDSLFESIQEGLRNSEYVIVILSKGSMERPWVRKEVAAAFNLEVEANRKRVLPAIIEECDIPIFLKDKLYADFSLSYEEGFESLFAALDIDASASSPTALIADAGDVLIKLEAEDGSYAEYEKTVTSVCHVNEMRDLVEYFTSDGRIENVSSSAGEITEVWTESNITYYRTELKAPLKKGDTLTRTVKLVMRDAFLNNIEYWEGKQFTAAKHYGLKVLFPERRPPSKWRVEERDAVRAIPSHHQAQSTMENMRCALLLAVERPVLYRTYILRWWW